jgi:hypothetical protein
MTHPEAVEDVAGADIAAPELAAIQNRYEEAKAVIIDPGSPLYPATEAIDVHAVMPPVPHAATPPTEAMSTAARLLAEELVTEEARPSAVSPGPRQWWRAVRVALQGAVPVR